MARPRRTFKNRYLFLAFSVFVLLLCVLTVIAEDQNRLHVRLFQAEVIVRFDPDGHYDRVMDRLGMDDADRLLSSIDTELEAALRAGVSSSVPAGGDLAGGTDLQVTVQPDGRSLAFIARDPVEEGAKRLVEAKARDFAEQRNATAKSWLREQQTGDNNPEKPAAPGTPSVDEVTFENLSDIDGSGEAMQLLLERAVLRSNLSAAADDAERDALEAELDALEQKLGNELRRLVGKPEDQAADAPADMPDKDRVTPLEATGAYVVAEAATVVLLDARLDHRLLTIFGLISLSGACVACLIANLRSVSGRRTRTRRGLRRSGKDEPRRRSIADGLLRPALHDDRPREI